jgi:hypothetical protein
MRNVKEMNSKKETKPVHFLSLCSDSEESRRYASCDAWAARPARQISARRRVPCAGYRPDRLKVSTSIHATELGREDNSCEMRICESR